MSSLKVTPTASDTANASMTMNGTALASGTVSDAINLSVGSSNTITVEVTAQNGATKIYTVTVTRAASSGNSTPARPVIDNNGVSLNPDTIDTTKPSITLEVTPKDGMSYVSIPVGILTELAGKNATFFIEIKSPYGSYQVPVNLAALIPGLKDLLAANNVNAEDISFRINLSDKSGDKAIQAAFANSAHGSVLGAIVDFNVEIVNVKTGKSIGSADKFSKALTRVIPMPRDLKAMPEQWGAFRYNETLKKFEFVAAKKEQIDGIWYAMINSYTNSIYAVAENKISFTDIAKHWSEPFVELAAAKGLVEGVGGNKYAPNASVTRAEFTAMLVRSLSRASMSSSAAPFSDVKSDAWYASAIAQARELGLLDFVKGSSFKPDQPITREEMASMLAAVVALEQPTLTNGTTNQVGFKDMDSVNAAYLKDVGLVVKLQLMNGTSAATFSPKGITTRAQAATVLVRALQTLGLIDK